MSDEGLGLSSSEDEAPTSRAESSGLGLDYDEENASRAIVPGGAYWFIRMCFVGN